MEETLKYITSIGKELTLIEEAINMLYWDQQTIMPKQAVEERGEQIAYLTVTSHRKYTAKGLIDRVNFLAREQNFKKLSKVNQVRIKKLRKSLRKARKIPPEHVEEFSRLVSKSLHAWKEAKAKKDFTIFAPFLEKVVDMKIKEARYIDPKKNAYDVLLDSYEEGMTAKKIDKVFPKLRNGLIKILEDIEKTKQYKQQKNRLTKEFPIEDQRIVVEELRRLLFLSPEYSVVGETVHPFMLKVSEHDVRISTTFKKNEPFFSFSSTAHEAGHALYELGFDPALKYTILHASPSLGMHESQSRFWENQIVKSKEFWDFFYPNYKKHFKKALKEITKKEFYKQINQVKPTLIRTEADEVTYCLHVIIRYELEKALLEEKIKVKDLPIEWNKKYKEYLGIVPKNHSEGVLQDMHWSEGLFGYFPTYALGTIYASMLLKQLKKERKNLEKEISKGELKPTLDWLREKIHRHGAIKLTDDLITEVCGKGLDSEDYLEYLRGKYSKIYA